MKSVCFVVGVALLAASSFAQEVKPASLTLEAVPGDTSPSQDVIFDNTGDAGLAVTVSISGPFAIPRNLCGRELKPGRHCEVWVNYTPEGIETDTGTLAFTFNDQTASVQLTGNGVNLIPTETTVRCEGGTCRGISPTLGIKVSAGKGYMIPNGEQVDVTCVQFSGRERGTTVNGNGTLEDEVATVSLQFPYKTQRWHCYATYNGDAEFASSSGELHTVW